MALQSFTGIGPWVGPDPQLWQLPAAGAFTAGGPVDATGEKFAFVGRVWLPARTGTKAVRRVCCRWGTVTKAGGSALTISLQDVSTSSGPPTQPDETQDQTVAVANADGAFASNTWYRSGTLSADRTVTHGDPLSVVFEYDGSGRLGSDAFNLAILPWNTPLKGLSAPVLKSGAGPTWGVLSATGNLVLEMSDGTFGTLEGCPPVKAFNTHAINSGSGADEYAMPFQVPFPCKVDALRAAVNVAGGTSDFEMILYQGTTALATVAVDANTLAASAGVRVVEVPIAAVSLAANTTYYVAVRPTTTNNLSVYSIDVDDANHLTCHAGGTAFSFTTRVDLGSWAAATATRQLLAGVRLSAFDDGAGGGSPDYPATTDVRDGVTFASGALIGNMTLPAIGNVRNTTQFGANGTQYTGNMTLPAVGHVRDGDTFGAAGTEFTGTDVLPDEADVADEVDYGAGGTEFTGTLTGGGGGGITLSQLQDELDARGLTSGFTDGSDTDLGVRVLFVADQPATTSDGTATAGGASTITLATGVSYPTNDLAGRQLELVGGTGARQIRVVASNTNATPSVVTMTQAWTVQPDNTSEYIIGDIVGTGASQASVDAIAAKTANLPADPADASDIAASFATVDSTLATIAAYIDTEVAAIKAKTDNLPASPASSGDVTAAAAAIIADTEDIQSRLPDALVNGNMKAAVKVVNNTAVQGSGVSNDKWRGG